MKTWLKILITLCLAGIVSAFLFNHYVINKPHPDYEKEPAKFSLKASELYKQYTTDRKTSEKKYNGQLIEIDGKYTRVEKSDTSSIVVFAFNQGMFGDEGIRCTLLPKYKTAIAAYPKGSEVKIKGFCSGYNDTDIILTKCSIQK